MKENFAKYKKMIILLVLLGVAMLLYVIIDNYEQRIINDSYNPVNLSACVLTETDNDKIQLTIPSDYVYEATQEQLDETAKLQGYDSVILNDNNTVTYTMDKSRYEEMMETLDKKSREAVQALSGNQDFSAVSSIEINEDFNRYTVKLSTDGSGFDSQKLIASLRSYSSMMDAFKGKTKSTIKVSIININDKEIASYDDTVSASGEGN